MTSLGLGTHFEHNIQENGFLMRGNKKRQEFDHTMPGPTRY